MLFRSSPNPLALSPFFLTPTIFDENTSQAAAEYQSAADSHSALTFCPLTEPQVAQPSTKQSTALPHTTQPDVSLLLTVIVLPATMLVLKVV